MCVVYAPASLRDVTMIGDFIALENRRRAESFVGELQAACETLANESLRYPVQERWTGQIRRMPVCSYLVLYRVLDDRVQVLRVLHGARDLREIDL